MRQWFCDMIAAPVQRAVPILSFLAILLMDVSVRELISRPRACAAWPSARRQPDGSLRRGRMLRVSDDEAPVIAGSVVSDEDDLAALTVSAAGSGRTSIHIEGIRNARERITDRPILTGPYSLAGRLMDVAEAMYACHDESELVHGLLEKAAEFLIRYCRAYRDAGVVMAEPLAGLFSPSSPRSSPAPASRRSPTLPRPTSSPRSITIAATPSTA